MNYSGYASKVASVNSDFSEFISLINSTDLSTEWTGNSEKSIADKLNRCCINANDQSKCLTSFISALRYAELYQSAIEETNKLINTINGLDTTASDYAETHSYYERLIDESKVKMNEYKSKAIDELGNINSITSSIELISYAPSENYAGIVEQIQTAAGNNNYSSIIGPSTSGSTSTGVSADGSTTASTGRIEGSGVVDYSALGDNYQIVNTNESLEDYLSVISSKGIKQTTNTSVYGDSCLAVAYIHAYSMYSGDTSAGISSALNYTYASNFKEYTNDNKQAVLNVVYDEVSQGKPVILQVNGNTQGTSRHYVTVVGFNKNVSSGSALREEDLLIIDSWDGKLENMNSSSSRFMIPGSNTAHRNTYTGYQIFTIR